MPINTETMLAISDERARQDRIWGEQNHPGLFWLAILMEEIGELAKALLTSPNDDSVSIREEAIHTAAVAVAWLECIERRSDHGS